MIHLIRRVARFRREYPQRFVSDVILGDSRAREGYLMDALTMVW